MVVKVGDRSPRSSRLMNVGCLPQAKASFSCERPFRSLKARSVAPKASSSEELEVDFRGRPRVGITGNIAGV